jgi:CRISPR-associated protein Csd1
VDGVPIPRDLVESCVRRASSRQGIEGWEWEKTLGVACALYRYQEREENYAMALERDRVSRSYLYGRLLALAEGLEAQALYYADEKRETAAARLMQRFADRPFDTWRTIEPSLGPYKARLRARGAGFLHFMETEIDQVMDLFVPEEFTSDDRLTGEFLLGYHCQRAALRTYAQPKSDARDGSDDTDE